MTAETPTRNLVTPGLLVALVTIALVVSLVVADFGRASPGVLSAVHGEHPELSGSTACAACHGGAELSLADACLSCHAAIGEQLQEALGLHGGLAAEEARDCGDCHVEHEGADFPLVGDLAFARTGTATRDDYRHGGLAWTLAGRHARLVCRDCHPLADAQRLEEGDRRYLGLTQRCSSCHEDPHQSAYGEACATCHGQERAFEDVAALEHDAFFELHGAHSEVSCESCHAAREVQVAVELLAEGSFASEGRRMRACEDCHESSHDADFLERVDGGLEPLGGEGCAACHDAEHRAFEGQAVRAAFDPRLHACSGFELAPPHAELTCAACHDDSPGAERARVFPGRAADECSACHGDPHRGEFAGGPFGGTTCLGCHGRDAFAPPEFGPARHADTGLALEGAHARADCADCHRGELEPLEERSDRPALHSFAGLEARCDSCHADVHDGWAWSAAGPADAAALACNACHSTESFRDEHARAFDHGAWTGFPLDGAHGPAQCAACHRALPAAGTDGRTAARAAGRSCEDCHEDVHAGTFAGVASPGPRPQGSGCARCHTTSSFGGEPARSFDHGPWTAFPLEGAHARASCEACHAPEDAPGPQERGLARALGADCADCHRDVHAGAFDGPDRPRAVAGRRGCARCHDAESFDVSGGTAFDHALWTGTLLAGAHERAACSDCHGEPVRAAGGSLQRSVAPPIGDCAACHADPHLGQFTRDGASDCGRCHLVGEGFDELLFDHQRHSRFPLDADHRSLECSACHQVASLSDGRRAVRYRPLGTACADCHDPEALRRSGSPSGKEPGER